MKTGTLKDNQLGLSKKKPADKDVGLKANRPPSSTQGTTPAGGNSFKNVVPGNGVKIK